MRPNLYQASRMLTTAGVTADIYFNPTQITTRMRRSIQRQIAAGNITGGWSSHASRIAKILCEQFNLPYVKNVWHGISVRTQDKETQERMVELVRADLTAYLLSGENSNNPYYKRHAEESVASIRAGEMTYVRVLTQAIGVQMMSTMMKARPEEEIQRACDVADMLDLPHPIRINQHNWKD